MPVSLISSPAELPADASPGLFVLVGEDPSSAAAAVAERLGAGAPCTPGEAAGELARREAAAQDAAARADAAAQREEALRQARGEAAEALARVPAAARGVDAGRLRRAAAAVGSAREAAADARLVLGERPDLPVDAAEAALAAAEAVDVAGRRRASAMDRSSTMLLAANGVGILMVAARLRTPLVDPVFALVAVCPAAALAHLVATAVSGRREARAARRLRDDALRRTGMATMSGVIARHARVRAWTARAEALAKAEARLAEARRRWAALAGPSADPDDVEPLVSAAAEAERASAAVALLESADAEGEGGSGPLPGLVVLVDGRPDEALDAGTRSLLERLAADDAPATAVVVTARSAVGYWAGRHDGRGAGADVLDLRERLAATLERLRSRANALRDATPPGPIAAGG